MSASKDKEIFDKVWDENKSTAALLTLAGLVLILIDAMEDDDNDKASDLFVALSFAADRAIKMSEERGSEAEKEMANAVREGAFRQSAAGNRASGTQDVSEGSSTGTR